MKDKELTVEEARIYNAVPIGRDNAVPLETISAKLGGMTGREIRKTFESLCEKGYVVCNLRAGYFLPNTADDYDCYYALINAYCKKFKSKLHHLKAARVRDCGEPSITNPVYPKRAHRALQTTRGAKA